MDRLIRALISLLLAAPALGQTYTPGNREEPVAGPLRSSYVATQGRKMVDTRDLGNVFVKSAEVATTTNTNDTLRLTVQASDDTEAVITFQAAVAPAGVTDGVINGATWTASTKMLVLTTSLGGSFDLDMTDLQNATDVANMIADWAEDGNTSLIPAVKLTNILTSATPENVTTGSGSVGTATTAARADHVHGGGGGSATTLSDSTPEVVTTGTGSSGTSAEASRSDHQHGGDQVRPLATAVPQNVISGTGTVGTSTNVAREDHVHGGAGGGAADGVVSGGSFSAGTLTLTRTNSLADVTITGFGTGGGGITEAEANALIRNIVQYHDGDGPPATDPTAGGELAIDNAGKLYGTVTVHNTHTTTPTITSEEVTSGGAGGWYRGYDTSPTTFQGRFSYNHYTHSFHQLRGANTTSQTWGSLWAYVHSSGLPQGDRVDYRQSIYLGYFNSMTAAAEAMGRNNAAIQAYSGSVPSDGEKAYYIDENARQLRRVLTFTAGTTTGTTTLTWRDAPLTAHEVDARVKAFARDGGRGVRVGDMDSESATANQVPLADGSGDVSWGTRGILQTAADARYARPSQANTFTALQTIDYDGGQGLLIDARGGNFSAPAFGVRVGANPGNRKGFQIHMGDQGTAWASFEFDAGGTGNPGFALGPGTAGRDVALFRSATNTLSTGTNDIFLAGVLQVQPAGLTQTQTNLGIVTTFTAMTDTPGTITASQCVQGNAAGDALIFGSCGTGMGGSTFLGLSDTPGTFTGQARELLAVNAAEDAVEFIDPPTPAHAIPNVGRLPAVTDDSEILVFLSHDYTEGTKANATLTVGVEGGLVGYSDGNVLTSTFGSIGDDSPMNALFGGGTAANYSIQSLVSFNEGWINDFTHVEIAGTEYQLGTTFVSLGAFERRLIANPTGLNAATLSINFKRADDTWYFNDAGATRDIAGLWEKVDGAYRRLTSKGFVHVDGVGEPDEDPTAAAQSYVDDLGRMWVSGDRVIHPDSPPEILASEDFMNTYYSSTQDVFNLATATDGLMTWFGTVFFQRQGTQVLTVGWHSGWQYIVHILPDWEGIGSLSASMNSTATTLILHSDSSETVSVGSYFRLGGSVAGRYELMQVTAVTNQGQFTVDRGVNGTTARSWSINSDVQISLGTMTNTAENRRVLEESVFVGHFATLQEAADERALYTDDTIPYYFITEDDPRVVKLITNFANSSTISRDHFFWNGPLITSLDALDVVEETIIPNPQFGDPTADLSSVYLYGTIYDVESVVHRNRVTGDLRLATENDWDAVNNLPLHIAWDGRELLSARRLLEGAHTAEGDFATLQDGFTVSFNVLGVSNTFRYRGAHTNQNQISNPALHDWYYARDQNVIRLCRSISQGRCDWASAATSGLVTRLQEEINYVGRGQTREESFILLSANGQRVSFLRRPFPAKGEIEITGSEGTVIPLGTVFATTGGIEFETYEEGTIPAAGMISLDARAVTGGSNGNIPTATGLSPQTTIQGFTAAAADGAFSGGDDVSGGVEIFTVSNFQAADASHFSYTWRPLQGFEAGFIAFVGPDEETGVLRNAHESDYNAVAGRSRVVGFNGEELLKVGRRLLPGHTASATLTATADRTTVGVYRWCGVHWQDYLVDDVSCPTLANNDLYWNRTQGFRRYDGSAWHSVTITTLDGRTFIGGFATRLEALAHLSANNQYVIAPDANGNNLNLRFSSNFQAGTTAHYEYLWLPLITFHAASPGSEFTQAGVNLLRDFGEVEPGDVEWTLDQGFNNRSWGFWDGADSFGTRPHNWNSNIRGFYYTDGGPQTDAEEDRWILWYLEGASARRYDDAKIRIAGTEYTLSYSHRDGLDTVNGYLVDSLTNQTYTDGQMIAMNLEDVGGDIPYDLPGTPWVNPLDPFVAGFTPDGGGGDPADPNLTASDVEDFALVAESTATIPTGRLGPDITNRLLPLNPTLNQVAQWNGSAWVPATIAGGGTTTFLGLTDTPSTYTASNFLAVNAAGDAIEFVAAPGGTGDITAVNTPTGSGLEGGVASGAANLRLDYQRLLTNASATFNATTDRFAQYNGNQSAMLGLTAAQMRTAIGAGTGNGDITGVTTGSTSGLNGGAASGTPSIVLDFERMTRRSGDPFTAGSDLFAMFNDDNGGMIAITLTEMRTAVVTNPFTDADETKLDGIATGATRCRVFTTYSTADTYNACDVVVLTQDQYNAIATKTAGVIYKIMAP